ncbi:MAG: hypothetical protein U1F77_14825 [Kiritimatiellia bacterium]
MLVFTPFFFAAWCSAFASQIRLTSGFWTHTWMPRLMAIIAAGKWAWSGVEIVTPSILSPIVSNISL